MAIWQYIKLELLQNVVVNNIRIANEMIKCPGTRTLSETMNMCEIKRNIT